jgi:heme/copper-type cytochrome/quinol oxidase subunit 2
MQDDTAHVDSLAVRPLPRWLTDRKEGLTTYKPREVIIKEDNSLIISVGITGLFVVLVVIILTVYIKKKHKKKQG